MGRTGESDGHAPNPRTAAKARGFREHARLLGFLAATAVAVITLTGGLGDPTPGGFIRFDDVRREAFTAIAVQRTSDGPHATPLVLRVNVIGDARDADITPATDWLAKRVNVRVVRDPAGAPLYLTHENLIATSGPSALGATVRSGMVVEMRDPAISPCVLTHELLHFLGLHHVDDGRNIMFARCGADKLPGSTLTAPQKAEIDALSSITAVTSTGVVTWATR